MYLLYPHSPKHLETQYRDCNRKRNRDRDRDRDPQVGAACGGMAAAGNLGAQKIMMGAFGLPFGTFKNPPQTLVVSVCMSSSSQCA